MSVIPVALRLKALRERSKVPMRKLATAASYRTASGYQRYEDPDLFTKKYLPLELVEALLPVLAGKGDPPIQPDEVMSLAGTIAPGSIGAIHNELRTLPPERQREVWDMLLRVAKSYKIDLKPD